ncbi:polyprenyl synthetase family protein [Streptomyces albireticuli]|uniref:polyprenyl synthetase family protein n=1 Tax=Streptomyces albireticuli TaxID=1940 RepID=UPI0036CB9186
MTVSSALDPPVDPADVQADVEAVLREFLTAKSESAVSRGLPADIPCTLRGFLEGGKRLRPLLCWAGWRTAGGRSGGTAVLRVAAALEMFHAFCLIHDDIMDRSATRRGHPTVHRALAMRHPSPRGDDAAWWGGCAARS